MEGVRGCIEFLANIVGALGIVFFLYEFSKDRKEAQKKLKEDEQKVIELADLENKDFILTRKFIYQNAIARINLRKNPDTFEKLGQLLYGEFYDENHTNQEDDVKFVAIEDALLEIKNEVLKSLKDKEIYYLNVVPEIVDEESNVKVSGYIKRINRIENIIQEICSYLFEESLKYKSSNNTPKTLEMLDDIYSIKSEVDKRSIEQNDLYMTEDSKIEFLIHITRELKKQFNNALAETDTDISSLNGK